MTDSSTLSARSQAAKRTALLGGFVNVCLGGLKILGGVFGHSAALFADGIHSFSDLSTDILVWFASHYGSQGADQEHPYGHQRIETAATLLLAMVVVMAGAAIGWEALNNLFRDEFVRPASYVLYVAAFSILANEGLYHYTRIIGKKIRSSLLLANAWHHRSDAASSIIVFIGVLGAILGFHYFDAIAAVIVALFILKMGWRLGWSSVRELIDTAVEPKTITAMEKTIIAIPGVRALHQLRTRSMGHNIVLDVHVQVAPYLSVSEGHHISHQVHRALKENCSKISDVTVHIDPENDEIASPSYKLPMRNVIEPQLKKAWKDLPGAEQIQRVNLHYLDGQLKIAIVLPLSICKEQEKIDLLKKYKKAISEITDISDLKIYFEIIKD